MDKTIYQFRVISGFGAEVKMDAYRDKVLLIVNTASECGFTPQFKEMVLLKEHFKDEPFEVLAFPSNDFGNQEPLANEDIVKFCEVNYQINFPIFGKLKVRGKNIHPLFNFLSDKNLNGKVSAAPRWNFHKYLVNYKGEVVDFFYPFTKPDSSRVKKKIKKLLAELKEAGVPANNEI